ncbi:hypothetical protein ACJMK2_010917 [Sinanodonta woodiana]|uniref:Tyrosinase copper-binding domain-containing protein n=1 Tax=Sinanodonta woodiana TaxID=1069815 RepID=A0ABD3VIH1_SINWO
MYRPQGLLYAFVCFTLVHGLIEDIPMPQSLLDCLNSCHKVTNITTTVGEHIYKVCLETNTMRSNDISWSWVNASWFVNAPIHQLHKRQTGGLRFPPSGFRIRKEYRQLTDSERNRFHAALNRMQTDGVFEEISSYHRNIAGDPNVLNRLHQGPSFLGWHRAYITLLEEVLRRYDNSVTLPYWDSTLDFDMVTDPSQSIIWTSQFLGNGQGTVTTGPFARWPGGQSRLLTRGIINNRRGRLISKQNIANVLTRCRTSDVSSPPSVGDSVIEAHHNGPHNFVGGSSGDMSFLQTATYDPVFFMHHAFVDYIWELFRQRQRTACNINPATDYPANVNLHEADRQMWGRNLSEYRNIDGYADFWTDNWYRYEPAPSCSRQNPNGCGSQYLECDLTRNVCVSRTRSAVNPAPLRRKRNAIHPTAVAEDIEDISINIQFYPLQNTYSVDGEPDSKNWVYFPVQVINMRPSDYTYTCYPYYEGKYQKANDIYFSPFGASIYSFAKPGAPKEFSKCLKYPSGAFPVYVQSNGINYYGVYTDYAIVDSRLPLTSSMIYIGVRKPPINGASEAILSAHDICGRVCKPQCLIPNSKPIQFRPCSGAIRLTQALPKMFKSSITDAVVYTWKLGDQIENSGEISIAFICLYEDNWPWLTANIL